jgi:hypothetical protein
MKIGIAFLLIILWFVSPAQHYEGEVLDSQTTVGLPGANIFLVNNWRVGTVTNAEGDFVLNVPAQDLKDSVIISFMGYEEVVVTLDKLNGGISLNPNENELELVVVEEQSLVAAEFKYEKIDQLDIFLNPASKADPLLAVATLPSATNADESANISLRGSGSDATGIFFNDVPIYDAVRFSQINGIGTFGIFNTAIVNDVTVFPGNPPLEYGNVSSGLVSISTPDALVTDNNTSIGIGLASFGFMRSQKISNKVSLRVFGNYQPSAVLKYFNQESLQLLKTFDSFDLGVLVNANLSSKSAISFFNYSLKEHYEYLFSSPSFEGNFTQNRQRNFSIFNFRHNFDNGQLAINSGLSFSEMDYTFSKTEINLKKEDAFVGINYSIYMGSWDFKIGFSSDNRVVQGKGVVPIFNYALAKYHPHVAVAFDQNGRVNELFLYAKNYVSEKLIFGYGLRKSVDLKEDYLSGQINMSLDWSPTFKMVVGIGRYHRLAFEENADNKRMLQSDQLSVDFKYKHNLIKSGASFFVKKEGIDQSRWIKGAEYYLQGQLHPKLSGDISVTFLDINQPNDFEIERLQEVNYFIKSNFKWAFGEQINMSVFSIFRQGAENTTIISSTFDDNLGVFAPNENNKLDRLPNYLSVGLSVSKVFVLTDNLGMIGYLNVNNVLNRENISGYSYSADYESREAELFSLRTIYFGAQFSF